MKNLTTPPPQQKAKSIHDLTPGELAEIDSFQNRNRGFYDEDEEYEEGSILDDYDDER